MKNKPHTSLKITLSSLFLTFLLCGCQESPTWEFHTGANGAIIWRCNRRNGEVEWASAGGKWQPIEYDPADVIAAIARQQRALEEIRDHLLKK